MKSFFKFVMAMFYIFAMMAVAQAGVLDNLKHNQTIKFGVRSYSPPFAFFDKGKAEGYSVEVCEYVANKLKTELKLPSLKIEYFPVDGNDRFTKVADGSVDIECGSTANTTDRNKTVAFTYTTFVTGIKFAYLNTNNYGDLRELNNKRIAIVSGSTAEKLLAQIKTREYTGIKLMQYKDISAAVEAVATKQADMMSSDDILMLAAIANSQYKNKFVLSEDYVTIEPFALLVNKNDAPFEAAVNQALASLFASSELPKIYNKWFNNETIKLPMSNVFKEVIKHPGKDNSFVNVFGYSFK